MKKEIEIRQEAKEILRLGSTQGTSRMKALSIDEQCRLVLSLEPGPQRQKLILLSDRPDRLTQAIPLEDFALTVKEIGDYDSLPLVEMSSNEQLGYLLDLDLWVKTDLDMRQVNHWMEIIWECDPKRFLRWTDSTDFELLVLLFERWCLLVDKDSILDLPDSVADRVISPDNFHYFLIKIGADLTLMQKITDLIFHEDNERFLAITGNLGTTPPAELEELVLRWRTARMADRGWPDNEEAAAFYQVLSPQRMPSKLVLPEPWYRTPRFPLQQSWTGPLFPKALELIEDSDLLDKLALQVANLINRVIIADGIQISGLQSLDEAGKVVAGRMEIGLVELGASDAHSAKHLISNTPLIFLAQVANFAIMKRRQRALNLFGESNGGLLTYLEPPLPESLNLLAKPRPVVLDDSGVLPRPVESMNDLTSWDVDLDLAEAALLLTQKLGIQQKNLEKAFPKGAIPATKEELFVQAILATSFVRSFLDLESKVAPVPLEDLQRLTKKLPKDKFELAKVLESWTVSVGQPKSPGLERLIEQMSTNLYQWLTRLDKADVNPHYMAGLWVQIEPEQRGKQSEQKA